MVVIVVAAGIQVGAWLLGMILYPGFPDERKKVLQYATICSNAGILGNPIAEGIFGSMGLLYASIYTIPQRTFMWSIGLTYFTQAPDMKTLIKKVSTHPCIVSVVIGMLIMVFQIPVPGFLSLTIKNIAGGNTFLAMSLVGTILAEVPFRSLYSVSGVSGMSLGACGQPCYRCICSIVRYAVCQCHRCACGKIWKG